MSWKDLKEESTEDLIDFIKCRDQPDYRELADAAFEAFTFRFRVDVIDKCRKLGKHWGYDNDTSDMLAEKTFERFLLYPHTFQAQKCNQLSIDVCVKLYLFKIAQRCFCDYFNDLSTDASPYDGTEEVVVEFTLLEEAIKSQTQRKQYEVLKAALAELPLKLRVIYLTYKVHERKGFKLPRTLLQKLRATVNLDQSSIRVYKKQATEKIRVYIKQHGSR